MTTFPSRLATCFGIGWSPVAPGTVASAVAVPLGAALALLGWPALAVGSVLVTLVGIWACTAHAKKRGAKDPSE